LLIFDRNKGTRGGLERAQDQYFGGQNGAAPRLTTLSGRGVPVVMMVFQRVGGGVHWWRRRRRPGTHSRLGGGRMVQMKTGGRMIKRGGCGRGGG